MIRLLPCGGTVVHATENPAMLRRRHVTRNLAIAEALTLLLQLRPDLLRRRTPIFYLARSTASTPVCFGISGSFAASVWTLVTRRGEKLYRRFESAAIREPSSGSGPCRSTVRTHPHGPRP